jgi:hypothetical protein
MVKTYKDFFKHLDYSASAKQFVEKFLIEPIAFKIKAEPGWKLIALAPTDTQYDVEVDLITIDEWAVFSSFHFVDLEGPEMLKRSLINTQVEQTIPIIPSTYNGKLKDFFLSIEEYIPKWNRVTIPSLMIGCIGPNDERSEDDVIKRSKEIWKASRVRMEKEKNNFISSKKSEDLESIISKLIEVSPDKSKLN